MEKRISKNKVQRICTANLKAVYYAIMRITGRYRKIDGDLYNYDVCYDRNFTTRELVKEIEEETIGLSYYQIRNCIKRLRLEGYIKFPEKGPCKILKSIDKEGFDCIKESFYIPDYLMYAIKQKNIDWKPCDTILLHYVLKKIDFYSVCRDKALDGLDKWNDKNKREEEIEKRVDLDFEEYMKEGKDPEEYEEENVYKKVKEYLHNNAMHAVNWEYCKVSFHEGQRKVSRNTKFNGRIVGLFIKKLEKLFGRGIYQYPSKPDRMMRYTYNCKSYTIALPPIHKWREIFTHDAKEIARSVFKKTFYYVTRTFLKLKKGYFIGGGASQKLKDKVSVKEGIYVDGEIIDREKLEMKRVSYPYMGKEYGYLLEEEECEEVKEEKNKWYKYRCYDMSEYEGYNANEFEVI